MLLTAHTPFLVLSLTALSSAPVPRRLVKYYAWEKYFEKLVANVSDAAVCEEPLEESSVGCPMLLLLPSSV